MSKFPLVPISQDLVKHSDGLRGAVIDSIPNSNQDVDSPVQAVLATMAQRNNPAYVAGVYASAPLNWIKNKVFGPEEKATNRRNLRGVAEDSRENLEGNNAAISEENLSTKVEKLIAGRKFNDAVKVCDELLEINPQEPSYNYFKGLALTRLKKYEAAAENFNRSLELNYDNANLYYQIGYVDARLGKKQQAVEYLNKALAKDPQLFEAHYELGEVLSSSEVKDYKAAINSYGEGLNIVANKKMPKPKKQYYLDEVIAKVQNFYILGADAEAIELSDKILTIDPHNSSARFNKDKSLKRLGLPISDEAGYLQNLEKEAKILVNPELALDACNQLIKINDQDPSYHHSKGVALLRLKKYEAAAASLVVATDLNKEDSNSQYYAGVAFARAKQYPQALPYLQRATNLNPNNILMQAELGDVNLELKNYPSAFDAYSKALDIIINDQDKGSHNFVKDRLKQITTKFYDFYQSGNYEMVIGLSDKLFDINPENPEITVLREKAVFRSGSDISNKKSYEQILYREMEEFSSKHGYKKALESCNHLIELHPQDATLYAQKGSFLSRMHRHKEAVQAYEAAININPKDAELYYNAGHALLQAEGINSAKKAESHLRKAVFLNPNNINAYFDLARITENKGANDGIVFYDRILDILTNGKISKDDPQLNQYEKKISIRINYFLNRAVYGSDNAKDDILELAQKFLKIKPQDSSVSSKLEKALFDIGSEYMERDYADRAEKYFDKLSDFGVRSNFGNYELAKKYKALGANEKSLQCYDKELEINSELLTPAIRKSIYSGKADVLYDMGRYKAAIENYEISMAEKDSNYASTKRNIALCHLALGNFVQAASSFYEVGFSADESKKVPNNSPINSSAQSPSKLNTPNNSRSPSLR